MKKRAGYKLIALLLCFVLSVCGITAALTVGAIRFVYPANLVDDAHGHLIQHLVRNAHPIRGHKVRELV